MCVTSRYVRTVFEEVVKLLQQTARLKARRWATGTTCWETYTAWPPPSDSYVLRAIYAQKPRISFFQILWFCNFTGAKQWLFHLSQFLHPLATLSVGENLEELRMGQSSSVWKGFGVKTQVWGHLLESVLSFYYVGLWLPPQIARLGEKHLRLLSIHDRKKLEAALVSINRWM